MLRMRRSRRAAARESKQQFRRVKRDVHGWVVLDKPVGMTSTHAVSAVQAAVPGQARRPRRHARSARLRLPADRARRGDQDRSVRDGRPQDLSLHGALGRGARHRRRRRPAWSRPARSGRTREAIEALLPRYTGTIAQVPPRFSAMKIEGERAYDLARDGETVELAGPSGRNPPARPGRHARTPTTPNSTPNAAKAPMCARSPATWAARSAASAISGRLRRERGRTVRRGRHDFAGTTDGPVP